MNKLIVIFLVVLLYGCDSKSRKKQTDSVADSTAKSTVKSTAKRPPELETAKRKLQTKSGKSLTVVESHPDGASLSDISIITKGFEKVDPIKIKKVDPIHPQVGVELADLDKNGFDEIYIYTQSAGSGSYGRVYAFASHKDKELKPVNCSKLDEDSRATDLKGYRGHDSFKIKGNLLVRTFPIYKEKDANASPSGGKVSLHYKLRGTKLVPVKK